MSQLAEEMLDFVPVEVTTALIHVVVNPITPIADQCLEHIAQDHHLITIMPIELAEIRTIPALHEPLIMRMSIGKRVILNSSKNLVTMYDDCDIS